MLNLINKSVFNIKIKKKCLIKIIKSSGYNLFNKNILIKEFSSETLEKINKSDIKLFKNLKNLKNNENINEIPNCRAPTFFDKIESLFSWEKARKLHEFIDDKHRSLGPIFRMEIGPVTAVFVNSPDYYRKIFRAEGRNPVNFVPEAWRLYNEMRKCPRGLLFMNGEEWRHFRSLLNNLLLEPYAAENIVKVSSKNAAIKLCEEWKFFADKGEIIPDLEMRLYRWSIEVMISTLIGPSYPVHQARILPEINILAIHLHEIFIQSAKLSLLPTKLVMKLKLPVWRKFVNVTDETMKIVRKLVIEMEELSTGGLLELMKESGIKNEDLIRIVTDLIIASGDTTAFSTQWLLFLLSTHPEAQKKFLDICKNKCETEILGHPYTKGALKESLRLYPTAPFIIRVPSQECRVGKHAIAQGELVVMSLYSSGRDELNFPRANEFLPERWIRNSNNKLDNVINLFGSRPFAHGARSCVGRKLAETQMILTLAEVVKKFDIQCENADSIKMILHMISVPSEPIKLRLINRN